MNSSLKNFSMVCCILCFGNSYATTYLVTTKSNLQTKMAAAIPGDTVVVANGTYDWGAINITNNNGSSTSNWIVLKAQTFKGVVFTGTSFLEFKGTRIKVDGFYFVNGNVGFSPVVQFRNSSGAFSNYCRITNIIVENYSSDTATGNNWVGLYGTHNRIDHCTFINKYNANPVIVVWYDNNTFPQKSTPTYHLIDSNYFKHIAYQGSNGGEYIRVGTGANCNTDGYNIVEYNLFEDGVQAEPEIISNKSNLNTYRYNTFKNTAGGLTLRRGRYCNVYGNFFIRDASSTDNTQYGLRIFEKGHNIFNNYFEGLNCNQGTYNTARGPIVLNNGESPMSDTITTAAMSNHFPAESCLVAFNTIVNCFGGAGIMIGYTAGGSYPNQPQGMVIDNNVIKMLQGTAVYNATSNTALTYIAAGNIYNAPLGLNPASSIAPSAGFTNASLTFGTRTSGVLIPPSLVQDAAINTANYAALLNAKDLLLATRSAIYDIGCYELNGTGTNINAPLDSNVVGAGKPLNLLPVKLLSFDASLINKVVNINWQVFNEINFKEYNVEWSNDAVHFRSIAIVNANQDKAYHFQHTNPLQGTNYYRLKMVDKDGAYQYSSIKMAVVKDAISVNIYPNPAQQFITVNLIETVNSKVEIIIYDSFGRIVKRENATSNKLNIDLKNFAIGMYQLQVITNNKQLNNYPFIISNK